MGPPKTLIYLISILVLRNYFQLIFFSATSLERNLTQSLRQQQYEAYELSLKADQEKERLKQLERDEIRRQQQVFEDELHAEQQRKEVLIFCLVLSVLFEHCVHLQEIARLKIEMASQVPSEPEPNCPSAISVLFKLPNGQRIERRFQSTDSLNVISECGYQIYMKNSFIIFLGRL